MTGKTENTPRLINQDTGMINDNTGLIEENTGLITETNEVERTASGRKKRSKERGKDSKPRNFPLHTMKNLPQFRDKSHEEVRQYILAKKGVDIGSNINTLHIAALVFIVLVLITSPLWIEKLANWYNKRRVNLDLKTNND